MSESKINYRFEVLIRPGTKQSAAAIEALQTELRGVAATCFDTIPEYQCLALRPGALDDKVIALARRPDGKLAGFCSGIVISVPGIGDVFHTGLTCVHPDDRGSGMTHHLTSRGLLRYIFSGNPIRRLWITNVACVLSSLGNIALFMEDVYPSPIGAPEPSSTHLAIAAYLDTYYRDDLYIRPEAHFDTKRFVFAGSVDNTVFQKDAHDTRFRHRNDAINDFYQSRMNFGHGDEVLQIGYVTLLTAAKHKLRGQVKIPALHGPEMEPALQA